MCWALGLSLRSVSHLLSALGCDLSRMSVWRDVQESGSNALDGWLSRIRGQVRLMGADETVLKVRGKRTVVGFVTDAESGRLVGMDVLVERDSDGFVKWLGRYVSRFGVESMVTDDLNTYKPVVGRLGVDHQSLPRARYGVCIAHVRKWVWNQLREIDGWDWCRSRIWRLMTELSKGDGRELLDMEPRVRGQPKLHRLVVELCDKWQSLTCHQRVIGIPQTNNCTERTIGRSKACAGLDPVSGTRQSEDTRVKRE